jgi:hypothetical protein
MFHVLRRKYSSYYMSHFRLRHNGFLKGKISNTRDGKLCTLLQTHIACQSLSVKICFLRVVISRTCIINFTQLYWGLA